LKCFTVCCQVKVGTEVNTGTGANKKVAKRNAAEAMLLQLGYKASTPLQMSPETMENKGWNGQRPAFPETTANRLCRVFLHPVYGEHCNDCEGAAAKWDITHRRGTSSEGKSTSCDL
ncbi:hypothetical protein DNTS_021891, partial [Danionella cerebrum]